MSSFCASILSGQLVPMDYSDASGTLLMDLNQRKWAPSVLDCAPLAALDLRAKLGGEPIPSHQPAGSVSALLQRRWGLNPNCLVGAASGDNPCTIAGLGLSRTGDLALSLGTSDALLGVAAAATATPATEGHVMAHPTDPDLVFGMLCYKNGGAARERVRDERCGDNWAAFDAALQAGSPGNDDILGLYLPLEEITPIIPRTGVWHLDATDRFISAAELTDAQASAHVLSKKGRATHVLPTRPRRSPTQAPSAIMRCTAPFPNLLPHPLLPYSRASHQSSLTDAIPCCGHLSYSQRPTPASPSHAHAHLSTSLPPPPPPRATVTPPRSHHHVPGGASARRGPFPFDACARRQHRTWRRPARHRDRRRLAISRAPAGGPAHACTTHADVCSHRPRALIHAHAQVAADVFNAPVLEAEVTDAAAVGAARRAAHTHALQTEHAGDVRRLPYAAFLDAALEGDAALTTVAEPQAGAARVYSEAMVERYRRFEDRVSASADGCVRKA